MNATSGQLFMVSSGQPPVESRSGGKVFRVIDADGTQWAIKVPKPSANQFQVKLGSLSNRILYLASLEPL
jgi:hypothetical protein